MLQAPRVIQKPFIQILAPAISDAVDLVAHRGQARHSRPFQAEAPSRAIRLHGETAPIEAREPLLLEVAGLPSNGVRKGRMPMSLIFSADLLPVHGLKPGRSNLLRRPVQDGATTK